MIYTGKGSISLREIPYTIRKIINVFALEVWLVNRGHEL